MASANVFLLRVVGNKLGHSAFLPPSSALKQRVDLLGAGAVRFRPGRYPRSKSPTNPCSLLSPVSSPAPRCPMPSRRKSVQKGNTVCQALPSFASPQAITPRLSPELIFGIVVAGIVALAASEIMEMNARTRAAYGNGESPLMSRPPTFMEHFCFARERVFSSGVRKTLFFFLFTMSIIVAGGYAWKAVSTDDLPNSLYQSWSFVAAPDNREIDHPGQRAVSAMLTVLGVFSFGLLIGLLSDSFSQIIEDFKTGKSRMILHGHTLVVGWNSWVPELVRHLAVCNSTEGRRIFKHVVVLGKVDKDTMDGALAETVGPSPSMDIMSRSVQQLSVYAMEQVNAIQADRIILIADVVGNDGVIQHLPILLALRDAAKKNQVAARVVNNSMLAVQGIDAGARALVNSVLEGFTVLDTSEYIARLLSKCTHQPGLSKVYKSLVEFEGTELHVSWFPQLGGKTYGQAWRAFGAASVCGVVHQNGVLLNPPDGYVIQPTDKLVYLAEDPEVAASSLHASPPPTTEYLPSVSCSLRHNGIDRSPCHVLMCGWRIGAEGIIEQLVEDMPPGSTLTVLNRMPSEQVPESRGDVRINHVYGSPVDQAALREILSDAVPDSIVLVMDRLGYSKGTPVGSSFGATDELSPSELNHEIDCQNLAALVMIDDILCDLKGLDRPRSHGFEGKGLPTRTVVELATMSAATVLPAGLAVDVIVPGELIAGSIAQVAYMPRLNQVFLELFNNRGSDLGVYLDAESSVIGLTMPCTFMTIVTAVRQSCGDMVIGLLVPQLDNPNKKDLLLAPRKDFLIKTLEGVDLVALTPNKYETAASA